MLDATSLVKRMQDMRMSGHLSDAILREAVKTIAASDERFDWVGVYLLDPEQNELWLHNYVGPGAEHAKIPVGKGVCGTAVAEKRNINVPDVTRCEEYLACNEGVRSELVVLIRAGDEILGQIDVDSNQLEAFTEEDEAQLQIVADKLAESIVADRE